MMIPTKPDFDEWVQCFSRRHDDDGLARWTYLSLPHRRRHIGGMRLNCRSDLLAARALGLHRNLFSCNPTFLGEARAATRLVGMEHSAHPA